MRNLLPALARLGVSLWAGAVAGVAFVVAPRVFGFLADPPRAGELMGPIFRRVDLFGIGAAVLFAVASRGSRWRFALACLLGAAAAANAFILGPGIAGGKRELHGLSEAVWGVILVGTLVLAISGPRSPPQSQP
jgi:peptidoglycan/LPS O-acetylase OafA/YrhL